ncbi:hypothetical protein, partial [Halalkalibacter alkalisediminis]|uniref:hypothetical protein n=1 Tax=Halalkalibacter alkalisediminis TaxID=935616 RepID=UPI0023616E9E
REEPMPSSRRLKLLNQKKVGFYLFLRSPSIERNRCNVLSLMSDLLIRRAARGANAIFEKA